MLKMLPKGYEVRPQKLCRFGEVLLLGGTRSQLRRKEVHVSFVEDMINLCG